MSRSIEYQNFGLVIHFEKSSPLPSTIFRDQLAEEGYAPQEDVQIGQNLVEAGGPPDFVLTNDGTAILYHSQVGDVVLLFAEPQSTNVENVAETVLEVILEDIGRSEDDISALEVQIQASVWDGEDTRRHFKGLYDTTVVSDIFDQDTSPFSVRWVSEGSLDGNDIHDIRVEPFAQNTDFYYIELRFSKPDTRTVIDFVGDIEEKIDKVLTSIEEE